MNQQQSPGDDGLPMGEGTGEGMGEGPDLVTIGVPRPPRRWPGRAAPLAGVAALALAGGAGVGLALTHSGTTRAVGTAVVAASSPTTAPGPSPAEPAKRLPRWPGALPLRAGLGLGFGGIVHGQFTAPKSGGGYQTVDVQRGTVSAVSTSSVTVKSADGFTATYAVKAATIVDAESAGIGSVKRGDEVVVTATVSGATATAADILDVTAVKAGRASFGFPDKPPAMPATVPAPPSPAA